MASRSNAAARHWWKPIARVRISEKLRRGKDEHRRNEDLREVKRLDEVATQQAFRQQQDAAQEAWS